MDADESNVEWEKRNGDLFCSMLTNASNAKKEAPVAEIIFRSLEFLGFFERGKLFPDGTTIR